MTSIYIHKHKTRWKKKTTFEVETKAYSNNGKPEEREC